MSRKSAWQRHAERIASERELLYPGSVPMAEGVAACPLHGERLGSLSRMCALCFREAWDWTAAQTIEGPS